MPNALQLLFKDGISSLSNTPGCDQAGMVFALTIASLTRDGKAAFSRLDDDVTQDITYALEMLMCYWAWLKQDKYWSLDSPEQLEIVQNAIVDDAAGINVVCPSLQRKWMEYSQDA